MAELRRPGRLAGYWRIVEMELWDTKYIDLVVPGFIEFSGDGTGEFQFGTVRGWLDSRFGNSAATSWVDFSWEGENDNDPGSGRGWAELQGDRLEGRLYIHGGDDSAFVAVRRTRSTSRKSPVAARRPTSRLSGRALRAAHRGGWARQLP
jgi:hypothetical protein